MDAFDLSDLRRTQAASGRPFQEFLRSHDLSVGLYVLPANAIDVQGPHTEDEVYHVVEGRARIAVGDDDRPVGPGSIVFVPAEVAHHFHDIAEDLVIVVFFGPAEYTHKVEHERAEAQRPATSG
jgi:mannose-6-phosphate isomerase-like protein (cupin superfamily)